MMSFTCAAMCLAYECCEITYVTSSRECRMSMSRCCHSGIEPAVGYNVLQSIFSHIQTIASSLSVSNGLSQGSWHDAEFCKNGHYAIGYRVGIEILSSTLDYTGLNLIEIICGSRYGEQCGDRASSASTPWIEWDRETFCQGKSVLVSFNLQVQPSSFHDDSGVNFAKFQCRNFYDSLETNDLEITGGGYRGSYGDWSDNCPLGSAVCGIQTRIEPDQGFFGDDMGVTDVKLFCCW